MKVVVDTNIVFSTLLNTKSNIAQVLLTGNQYFDFYSISLLKEEIIRHKQKILKLSMLIEASFQILYQLIISKIKFIDNALITNQELFAAEKLVKQIDINDTLFVAFAQKLNAQLWTGDKKLITGLEYLKFNQVISTDQILDIYFSKL